MTTIIDPDERFPWLLADPELEPDVATDHDVVAPHTWDDWVGQHRTKSRLQIEIASAAKSGRRLPHVFLWGPAGSGKTTLAKLVAGGLDCPVVEMSRPASEAEVSRALWKADIEGDTRGVLFLDEVHRWVRAQQDGLLTLLEQGFIDARYGRFSFSGLTVIAATTDRRAINNTVRERFPINLTLDPYSIEEMSEIVDGMAARLDVKLDEDTVTALAIASRGVPRVARNLVTAGRALTDAGMVTIADAIFEFTRIHRDGLTDDHIRYLEILGDCDGLAGLEVLTTRMMVHRNEVTDLERPLLDLGYIGLDSRGRLLTAVGRRRLTAAKEG